MTELRLGVEVPVPVETTWAAVVDWPRQSKWMLGTNVRVTSGDGACVGSELTAFTGIGPLGFTDTMRITEWSPPRRCVVRHTGRVVRGSGVFEVYPRGENASTLTWSELLELPLGAVGRIGWSLVRPVFALALRYSLNRFAEFAKEYSR